MRRRSFMKSAACAAALEVLSSYAHAGEERDLEGAVDMHVHCAPDIIRRKLHALEYVKDCQARGMAAVVLKCHQFNTNEMADTISRSVPGMEVFGSITLNETFGPKINVFAAEQALSMSDGRCRCVWLPTQSAVGDRRAKGKSGGIPVCDERGKVVPEVIRLMELCAEKNVILATGHSTPEECVAMAVKAHEVGVPKFVCTHVSSPIRYDFTLDQARICLENGAWLEHSFNVWYETDKDAFIRRIVSFIELDQFIDTDMGQPQCPHPCDGMRQFMTELEKAGCSRKKIRSLTHDVPAFLLGLQEKPSGC